MNGDAGQAFALFIIMAAFCFVLAALAGAGEWMEARSPRFSRWLDRVVGRPDGWE